MLKTLGRSEEFMTVMDKYEYEKNLTHWRRQTGRLRTRQKITEENTILNLSTTEMSIEEIAQIAGISVDRVNEIIKSSLKN